jgi:hypothetical protein
MARKPVLRQTLTVARRRPTLKSVTRPQKRLSQMVSAKQSPGNLRWIDYSRRSMQRLGFLKVVLRLALYVTLAES